MSKRAVFERNYGELLRKSGQVLGLFTEVDLTKFCRRCGYEFVTKSRVKIRCDACQSAVNDLRYKRDLRRTCEKRKAARKAAHQDKSSLLISYRL